MNLIKIVFVILLCCAILGMLVACSDVDTEKEESPSTFVVVEDMHSWQVVYHRETKVMYAVSDRSYNYGTFTLLVNPDGTPMLYEE